MSSPSDVDTAALQAKAALEAAVDYAWDIHRPEGEWCGEIRSDVAFDAEHIFLHQSVLSMTMAASGSHPSLTTDHDTKIAEPAPSWPSAGSMPRAEGFRKHILAEQNEDGSWGVSPGQPGHLSISCEGYLALKILGLKPEDEPMQRARRFIRDHGGVAQVRMLTRFQFAKFGLIPWSSTPELPVETMLLPNRLPGGITVPWNIYRIASWARSVVVPLLVIAHHRPVYALPNGRSANNTYLDELWLDPSNKNIPVPGASLLDPWGTDPIVYLATILDRALAWAGSAVRSRWNPVRKLARRAAVDWLLAHQETSGSSSGFTLATDAMIQALMLEGYTVDSDPVQRALASLQTEFMWEDEPNGRRILMSNSPVWDTALMLRAVCEANSVVGSVGVNGEDSSSSTTDTRMHAAVRWLLDRQLLGPEGDWRIFKPNLASGGWSFEYKNSWFPDTDDTAAVVMGLLSVNGPAVLATESVVQALEWVLGMQGTGDCDSRTNLYGGGWGAFDCDNNRLWINKVPFSDMDSLCDPSTPDVTGHILEALGYILQLVRQRAHKGEDTFVTPDLAERMAAAARRALVFLRVHQEDNGGWPGRWAINYISGTSNTLCGLAYFTDAAMCGGDQDMADAVRVMMYRGVEWLKSVQNDDGGWGEDPRSYHDAAFIGRGSSTASQTAWALMGLLAACPPYDPAVLAGVRYLLARQTDRSPQSSNGCHVLQTDRPTSSISASWPEREYTGTGFPGHALIGYCLYRHYFPTMALSRFVNLVNEWKGCETEKRI